MLQQEAACCGADDPAHLPGLTREGHVAPEERRGCEVGDDRAGNRAVEAFADGEDGRHDSHRNRCRGRFEPVAGRTEAKECTCPEHGHSCENTHPSMPFDQPRDRQLGDHDHERVDEPEDPDTGLADSGVVLREGGHELDDDRHTRRDQQGVEQHIAHERPVASDLTVAAGIVMVLRRRGRESQQDQGVGGERAGVCEKEHGEGVGVGRRSDQPTDETPEGDP